MPKYIRFSVAMILFMSLPTVSAWSSLDAGQFLQGAAVGVIVKQSAGPLDEFINTITLNNNLQTRMATKVVPILSIGEKGYIGGAQVSGPANEIKRVQAVFQYEQNLSNNNYRIKVLVPSASLNPLALSRVPKTGVTAIIDVSLDGRLKNGTSGNGIQLGDAARVAGFLVLVKNAGPTINQGINTLTLNKGFATKFVPWGSIGDKTYFGGAQVSASTSSINAVQAVWQYDGLFNSGAFRVKVMIPTNSTNPLNMKRVDGAGVTAVVDMALSEQRTPVVRRSRPGFDIPIFGNRSYGDDDRDENVEKRHDNGKHRGWTQGQRRGRKNEQVDEKWQEKERDD